MAGQIVNRGRDAWLVRIPLGRDGDGVRKYHNRTIRGTKKEAEQYRTRVLREMHTGLFVQASPQTLGEFLDQWVVKSAVHRVSRRTLIDYKRLIERHLRPSLGHRRLCDLTPLQIQSCYSEISDAGLSARTVRYAHSVLHNALEQAVKWQVLARNPAKAVTLPRMARREMQALSASDALRLLATAKGTRFEALWVLLLTTGLRPGEALGLRWKDIREDRIHIQRALVWLNGHEWELKEPKTARARRVVTIPQTTVRALQSHRAHQNECRLAAGAAWFDEDLVFANQEGKPLEWRIISSRYFASLRKAAGLPTLRPYDLRHSCATLLLAAGENIKVVSERLGHSSAALTLDVYSHVLPDMQQAAADKMDLILGQPIAVQSK